MPRDTLVDFEPSIADLISQASLVNRFKVQKTINGFNKKKESLVHEVRLELEQDRFMNGQEEILI